VKAGYLIETAARAPSVHNTQPWRFRVSQDTVELYADASRQLRTDSDGREMLVSCGAALYGLRLAVRSLGYQPDVEVLSFGSEQPSARLRLLARVRLGPSALITADERKMLAAMPRRHTHRGPFEPGPLPAGLLPRLQDDARVEGATLTVIDSGHALDELAVIVAAAAPGQDGDPRTRADMRRWSGEASRLSRDGVPAHAFPAVPRRAVGQLPQRDFDLGRGLGWLTADGPAAPVTLVLSTSGDTQQEWLQAGQALHRLLLTAASQWVFACLNTQPLEDAPTRALVNDCLSRLGSLQMLLQLGVSRTAHATARRPAADVELTDMSPAPWAFPAHVEELW
jgi:hypothetical protein